MRARAEGVTLPFRRVALTRPRLSLMVFCVLAWLPGFFTLPPGDRDESRFAQASKQMLESGDFVRIMNGDQARNRKPIGIYWLQLPGAAAARAMGLAHNNPIWPYRLPSLAGALLAVLAVHGLGRRLFGDAAALLAAALLAGSVILTLEAHNATTDAALLGATTVAMLLLGEAYLTGALSARRAAVFWLALGVGVLIKGPIAPMVAALAAGTLAVSDRRAHWLLALRPARGAALLVLVALPWFVAIGLATHGAFFREAVGGDMGRKLAGGDNAHGAPPGTHLLLLALTLFPGGWAVVWALPAAWAARREPATRFLLAWAVPAWLVFEAVPTKLPHYPLPLAPALLLLAARWLLSPDRRPPPRWLAAAALAGFAAAAAALGGGGAALPAVVGDPGWWRGLPALAAALLVAATVLIVLHRGDMMRAALGGLLAVVPLYWALLGFEVPALAPLWLAPRVAAALAAHGGDSGLAVLGFAEPSLMFLCGTGTVWLSDPARAAAFPGEAPGRVAVVEARALPGFLAAAAARGEHPRDFATVAGFNYANGRRVGLHLFDRP